MTKEEVLNILLTLEANDLEYICTADDVLDVPTAEVLAGGSICCLANTKGVRKFVDFLRDLAQGLEELMGPEE